MLRAVIFLQLTLWAASIHAFFPFIPTWQCEENHICASEAHKPKTKERDVVTYKLSQRVRYASSDPSASAAKEASRLLRKYNPLRTSIEEPELVRRENQFHVVKPATPTTPNSAGIYQDGTDFSYFIQVGLGSSAKPLFMLLDTGAGTTWVMGSDCKSDACPIHNSFGPADSKTYSKVPDHVFSVSYGSDSGTVAGVVVKDTLTFPGMTLSMSFGVATTVSEDFNHFPFDGILGLSMGGGASDNFLNVIKSTYPGKSRIFAVSLSRSSSGANTGEVTFGGTDPAKYIGQITYSPVTTAAAGDWAIAMDDLTYDGNKVGIKGRVAYIDTGSSYMFGPPADVQALHKLIPGAKVTGDGFTYKVPCDSNKVLTLSFSGVAYTISAKDWISPPGSDGTCTSNFYGYAVVENAWLFGDAFLKNVYSVYDPDQLRIGFANRPAGSPPSTTALTMSSTTVSSNTSPTTLGTTITPAAGTTSLGSAPPGLSGHETSATAGTPVAQTAGSSATATASSPGEQLEGNKYASIICIVAVIAMVA